MELTSTQVTLRTLTPSEGMWLTQVEDVEPQERIFSDKVFLAKDDAPENWREVDDAFKAFIESEQQKILNREQHEEER